ncbi:hypothetical protein BD410DRAFT_902262 [Rickenella mellea]|uniref:Uncharacterized protein n=1 Tax=Rickenella mellea TaxID=50990 RepID=A0A4Y7PL90_9AGAM|nr:hypothetical protein BD410DRAFT_902262 [Rickenella mellea]
MTYNSEMYRTTGCISRVSQLSTCQRFSTMSHSTPTTQQNLDLEKGLPHSKKVKDLVTNYTSTTISEEILVTISKVNSMDDNTQHLLTCGGLSAGIASQLISTTTTTTSPIAGGIAYAFLSVTCIMGLAMFIVHVSPLRDLNIELRNVLGYWSLWFAAIGIVGLAWAVQPKPVAVAVSIVFGVPFLAMVGLSTYVCGWITNLKQKLVK